MMDGMRTLIAALTLPLVLAACGGQAKEKADPAPTNTPAAPMTSATQWASALAGSNVVTAWRNAQDACLPLLSDLTSPTCGATLVTMDYTAIALDGKFDDLYGKGDPVPEVFDLVANTRAQLVDVLAATHAWHSAKPSCLMSDTERCADLAMGIWRAMVTFPGAEWQPYL